MENNKVTDKEFEEIKNIAMKAKKEFIKALSDKNILGILNDFNSHDAVRFIVDAKLSRRPIDQQHAYRMSFARRAVVQGMKNLLEQEVNTILGDD